MGGSVMVARGGAGGGVSGRERGGSGQDTGCSLHVFVSSGVCRHVEGVGGPGEILVACWGCQSVAVERGSEFADIDGGGLEIFELNVDELVGGSVFVGVSDDELQVTQRLFECGQLRLKLVQLADGCYGLVEVRDLWQGVHVFLDFADDLGIEGSLKL